MAYLHCHTKGCGWSQDDFYNRRYNPLTKIFNDIKAYLKPCILEYDSWYVEDIMKYIKFPVYLFNGKWRGKGQSYIFSWNWFIVELIKDIRTALKMKWWTWESWEKAKDTAVCPKCKKRNFDID